MTEKPRKKPTKAKPAPPTVSETAAPQDEDWELSKAQIRELERRVRDMDDPRRFVLASEFLPTFVLYYDVGDNVYVMNDPPPRPSSRRGRPRRRSRPCSAKGCESSSAGS